MTDCIVFPGSKDSMGYGHKRVKGVLYKTHRLAYVAAKGEIPQGLEIDHLCRNRACMNPDHLEAVTHRENVRRGRGAVRYKRSACPSGHAYTSANSYFKKTGHRICKTCSNEYSRRYYKERLMLW